MKGVPGVMALESHGFLFSSSSLISLPNALYRKFDNENSEKIKQNWHTFPYGDRLFASFHFVLRLLRGAKPT